MNRFRILRPKNKKEWLEMRVIGGTSAGVILGVNKWKSPLELYMELAGLKKEKEVKTNAAMERGTAMEGLIRSEFGVLFKDEYSIIAPPRNNWVYVRKDKPFMTASLDGVLKRKADGKRGVWECKTHEVRGRDDADDWTDGKLPDQYYAQVLHELNVTGWEYAILTAQLYYYRYDHITKKRTLDKVEIRNYYFDSKELRMELENEEKAVTKFYENVEKKIPPKVKL